MRKFAFDPDQLEQTLRVARNARWSVKFLVQCWQEVIADVRESRQRVLRTLEEVREWKEQDRLRGR